MRRIATRCAYLALAGLLLAIATGGGGTRTSQSGRGLMTPAIGAHPDYAFVGDAAANPALTVFGCQRRTVGNAACYGPDQIRSSNGLALSH